MSQLVSLIWLRSIPLLMRCIKIKIRIMQVKIGNNIYIEHIYNKIIDSNELY